ncbi:GldG family protein [Qiania dongpingensis]|uniref:GldG family protein n=1 Tax=Qiania dongpingensis TaxID=2763669 RepID=A0A7G9G161_9FIRM|nr:GldG family protein [Qiania dongpingensis]QNM04543.1 GldG family protein [Qiania dongpingensis]
MKRPNIKWNKKNIKHGSYSLVWAAAVIAIIIILNLIAAELPSRFTSKDMTANQYYTLSDQSKDMLKNVSEDVTIYKLTDDGSTDNMVENLLEQYKSYSGHIKVVEKDLVKYPTFAGNYTSDTLKAGSLIVECGEKSRVISSSDLYETSYDSSTYQAYTSGFDGEGQITSAVAYVTSEEIPKIYVLEGHGEGELSTELTGQVEKENIDVESLSLVSRTSIPEDAAALLINSPQKDFSDEETAMILDYLKKGGKAFITSTYTGEVLPNFNSILEYYGVAPMDSMVGEGDSNYYHPQSSFYLLPSIQSSALTSSLTSANRRVFTFISQGIETLDSRRDTLDITSLLKTSDSAYAKVDAVNMTTTEKEKGDIDGPFDLGVLITEKLSGSEGSSEESTEESSDGSSNEPGGEDTAAETKIVYFGSGYLLEEQMDSIVSGGNYELVMNCLSSLVDHETTVAIPAKSLETEYLTMTAANVNLWSIIMVAALPIAAVASGGVIWYRRRKR